MKVVTKTWLLAGLASAALLACGDSGLDGTGGGDTGGGTTTSNTGGASNTTNSGNTTSAGGGFITSTGGNGTGGNGTGGATNGTGGAATGGGGSATGGGGAGGAATGGGGAGGAATGGGGAGGAATGGGGAGGGANCTPITFDQLYYDQDHGFAEYAGVLSPSIGAAEDDGLFLQLYPSATTTTWSGMVDLASAENSNYLTCSTCILVAKDIDTNGDPVKWFYPSSGTVDFGSVSMDYNTDFFGKIIGDGAFTNVTLVEVTIDENTAESTPVVGGECLTITQPIQMDGAGWTCDPSYYDDGFYCDCGCGVVDPDCADASIASCDFCDEGCDSVVCDDPSSIINPTNNAVCVAP